MTAIEATARTARTLEDGTLRLVIEFEPKDAREAFNAFCAQGTKLAVVALKDGYYVEQHEFQPEPVEPADEPDPSANHIEPEGNKERFKINGRPASNWAAFQIKNPNFQKFMGVDSAENADKHLKHILNISSKSVIDLDGFTFEAFKLILSDYGKWCERNGIGNMPPVTREQAVQYLGGCLYEDEGLSIANEQ